MVERNPVADRVAELAERLFGRPVPARLVGWDGSESGPTDGPRIVLRSRRAIRRLLWQPNELGLSRAYVAGDLDVDGDLLDALRQLLPYGGMIGRRPDLSTADRRELLRTAVRLGAVGPQPKPPAEEVTLSGERHSLGRDRAAVSHHYDVGNAFYEALLGPTMVYSCAYFAHPSDSLDAAQEAKLDLVCRKLGLRPGMRVLDVGCGWGSLLIHAARHYDVHGVGVTLADEQLNLARKRLADAGLTDRVEVRLADYREVEDGPYDAIASIGMAEHVGESRFAEYTADLRRLLRPGGRLLNHQITRRPDLGPESGFVSAYIFPDGELLPLGTVVGTLEAAGLETRDVESLREHYPQTLLHWLRGLEENWQRCVEVAGEGRARAWRLYLAASLLSFEIRRISVHQVLCVRPYADGRSGMPITRAELLAPQSAPG